MGTKDGAVRYIEGSEAAGATEFAANVRFRDGIDASIFPKMT
jgi:hypothetical protein